MIAFPLDDPIVAADGKPYSHYFPKSEISFDIIYIASLASFSASGAVTAAGGVSCDCSAGEAFFSAAALSALARVSASR